MKRTGTLHIILTTLILSGHLADAAPYKRPYELPGYTGWQAAMKEVKACEDYLQMMQKDSELYVESKKKQDDAYTRFRTVANECYELTENYNKLVDAYNEAFKYQQNLVKQCDKERDRTGLHWQKIEVCRQADRNSKVFAQRKKKLDATDVEQNRVCKQKADLLKQHNSHNAVSQQYYSKLVVKYPGFGPGILEYTRKNCNELRAWMKQEEKKLARNTLDAIIDCEFKKADDLLKRLIPGATQKKLSAHRDRILGVEKDVRSKYKTANVHYRNGQASEKKAHALFSRGDSKASLAAFQQAQAQYSKAIGVLESQLKKSECTGTRVTLSTSLDKVKARLSAAQVGPGSQQQGATVGGSLPCAKYNPLDPACESSASGQATPQQLAKVKSLAEQFDSALPDSASRADTGQSSTSIPYQYSRPAEPSGSTASDQQAYGSQYGGGASQYDAEATRTDQFLKDVLPPPRGDRQTATTTVPGGTQAGQTQTTVPSVIPPPPTQTQAPFSAVGTWTGNWTAQIYQDSAVAGRCVWDVELRINAGMSGNLRMIGEGTAVVPDKVVACVQGDAPISADVVADTVVLHTVGTERAYNFRLRILNNNTLEMTDSIDGAPTSGMLRKK